MFISIIRVGRPMWVRAPGQPARCAGGCGERRAPLPSSQSAPAGIAFAGRRCKELFGHVTAAHVSGGARRCYVMGAVAGSVRGAERRRPPGCPRGCIPGAAGPALCNAAPSPLPQEHGTWFYLLTRPSPASPPPPPERVPQAAEVPPRAGACGVRQRMLECRH